MKMALYFVPFEEQTIIYRPLRRLAFVGNAALAGYVRKRVNGEAVARSVEIEAFLDSVDFWRPDIPVPLAKAPEPFRPAMGVLLLTNQCNLRCVYCYANAGERPLERMEWPLAKRLIDTVHDNAAAAGNDEFSISYHGGGEPTSCWRVFQQSAEYALSRPAQCAISVTSNGVWTDAQRRFICGNFKQVSLSFDGIESVQNRQRPHADGAPSFDAVMETVAALDEAGVDYGARMTVLPDSLDSVLDGVRYICENTKARSIQIEPTYTSQRGEYADMERTFGEAFARTVIDAYEVGRHYKRFVYYSAARPWVATSAFCSAPLQALVMTPTGHLVTCFEVASATLPHAQEFVVGHVTPDRVDVDHDAIRRFLGRQEERRSGCKDCFCYWHCAGDCATRSRASETHTSSRCLINQHTSRDLLASFIEQGEGVWMGIRERRVPESVTACEAVEEEQ